MNLREGPRSDSGRRRQIVMTVVVAIAVIGWLQRESLMKPTNICQTSPEHEDSRLRTRHYRQSRGEVGQAAARILPSLRTYGRRWRLTGNDSADKQTTLSAEVPVIVFTDDLVVTVVDDADGSSLLDVRSKSRVGRGDFGENRRHVLQFLQALDVEMGL